MLIVNNLHSQRRITQRPLEGIGFVSIEWWGGKDFKDTGGRRDSLGIGFRGLETDPPKSTLGIGVPHQLSKGGLARSLQTLNPKP